MSSPAPRRRLRRGVPAALLALVALLVGGLVVAAPAQADTGISGAVAPGTGGTLIDASAQIGTRSGTTFTQVGAASAASDGDFVFAGLAAGEYVIRLTSRDFQNAFVPATGTTATTNIAEARIFTINTTAGTTDAGTTTLAVLKPGTLTGTITNADGRGVPGARVDVRPDGAAEGSAPTATTTTAANGTYSVQVVPGTYDVFATVVGGGYQPAQTAAPVAVTREQTTTADLRLLLGTGITGVVALPDGPDPGTDPDPVSGVTISVESRTTGPAGEIYTEKQSPMAVTDVDGTFSTAVEPGDYVVGFAAPGLQKLYVLTQGSPAVMDDTTTMDVDESRPAIDATTTSNRAAAALIEVLELGTAADPTVIERAVLGTSGTLAGRVTTSSGTAIEAVTVALQRRQATADGGDQVVTVAQTTTAADGTYRFASVVPGTYKLFASAAAYADRYFPTASTFDGGSDVVVAAGQDVTGRDIVLAGNGTIVNLTKPWISGANQGGSTLTANEGTWAPTPTSFRYQWFNGANPIEGETARTFDIDLFSSGGRYSVEVTALAPDRNDLTVRSAQTGAATTPLQAPAFENRQVPAITGTPAVGQVLTVSNGQWSSTPTAFAYQWFADGVAIAGATAKTFTATADQLDDQLTARVTATSGTSTAQSTSEPTAAVARGALVNTVAPAITGDPVVGQVLTAQPGTWSVEDLTFTYQWLADGAAITGATSPTFTPAVQQAGKRLTVRVTAAKAGFTTTSATSPATAPVTDDAVTNVQRPTVSGTPAVGSTLTASPGTWTPSTGVTFAYQWLADGTPIPGATGTSYSPTSAVVGDRLSVRVTGTSPGRTEGTATSVETAAVTAGTQPPTVVGGPGVIGRPRLGQTLVVERGTVTPSTATATFQWERDGADIAGATGSSYQVREADLGRRLSVEVTYSSTGGTTVREADAGIARSVADIAATARSGEGAARLRLVVRADAVDDLRGLVRVLDGRREVGRVSLVDGRGALVLRGLEAGRTVLTLVYRPELRTTRDRERLVVRIPR